MIDIEISKISKAGRKAVNQEKWLFSGTGRNVLRWANGIYRTAIPRVRHRAGTMVGDRPVIETDVFTGVLAKSIEAIASEGMISVVISFNEISLYARDIRYHWDTQSPVPRTYFVDLAEYKKSRDAYEAFIMGHSFEITEKGRELFLSLPFGEHRGKRPVFIIMNGGKRIELNQIEYDVYTSFKNGITKTGKIATAIGRHPSDVSKAFAALYNKGLNLK